MNIEDSFRYDAYDLAKREGCSVEEAGRRLQERFEAKLAAEDAARTPEERAARAAEQQRNRDMRAECSRNMVELMRRRYGKYNEK